MYSRSKGVRKNLRGRGKPKQQAKSLGTLGKGKQLENQIRATRKNGMS